MFTEIWLKFEYLQGNSDGDIVIWNVPEYVIICVQSLEIYKNKNFCQGQIQTIL